MVSKRSKNRYNSNIPPQFNTDQSATPQSSSGFYTNRNRQEKTSTPQDDNSDSDFAANANHRFMSPQAETNRITTTEFVETMTIERGGDNDDLDE